MVTIVAHVKIKADRLVQFEDIEREIARGTKSGEPDCLSYECWRSAEENKYYVILAFKNALGFYNHQVSEWHEKQLAGLYECFETVHLEFVDPVQGAGSGLPRTRDDPLPADASPRLQEYFKQFPVITSEWWRRVDQKATDGPVKT